MSMRTRLETSDDLTRDCAGPTPRSTGSCRSDSLARLAPVRPCCIFTPEKLPKFKRAPVEEGFIYDQRSSRIVSTRL